MQRKQLKFQMNKKMNVLLFEFLLKTEYDSQKEDRINN